MAKDNISVIFRYFYNHPLRIPIQTGIIPHCDLVKANYLKT